MRRLYCALALVFVLSFPAIAQDKAPILVFESQMKDFDKVMSGVPLTHLFKFSNKGSAVLQIYKVEGS